MEKFLKKKAKEFMTKDVIAVKDNETIKHLFKIMDEGAILGVPIVDDEKHVLGIVTETDLIEHFTTIQSPRSVNLLGSIVYLDNITAFNDKLKDHCAETVKDLTLKPVVTITEGTSLLEILDLMSEKKISRLPVIDDKKQLIGIITRSDIVHQLAKVKQV